MLACADTPTQVTENDEDSGKHQQYVAGAKVTSGKYLAETRTPNKLEVKRKRKKEKKNGSIRQYETQRVQEVRHRTN